MYGVILLTCHCVFRNHPSVVGPKVSNFDERAYHASNGISDLGFDAVFGCS